MFAATLRAIHTLPRIRLQPADLPARILFAKAAAFVKATIKVFNGGTNASFVRFR